MEKMIYTKEDIHEAIESCIESEGVEIKEICLPTIKENNVYHAVLEGSLNLGELINIGKQLGDDDMLVAPFEPDSLAIYFIPTVEY